MRYRRSLLAKKFKSLIDLSDHDLACLSQLESDPYRVKRGEEIGYEGQTSRDAYILLAGWACSFKILRDGARQIISFRIPGDCMGLRSAFLRASDRSFSAVTDVIVSRIKTSRIFNCCPSLGFAVMQAVSKDDVMVAEHLVSIGRRNAIGRTAYFFLELAERLHVVGLGNSTAFACPLNQYELADALGLSAIHVNRVLRQLREHKLLTLKDRRVIIHDLAGLKALARYQNTEEVATTQCNRTEYLCTG